MGQELNRLEFIGSGKFKGCHVSELLADREYCESLMRQDWFCNDSQYRLLHDMIVTSRKKRGVVIPFPVEKIRR